MHPTVNPDISVHMLCMELDFLLAICDAFMCTRNVTTEHNTAHLQNKTGLQKVNFVILRMRNVRNTSTTEVWEPRTYINAQMLVVFEGTIRRRR